VALRIFRTITKVSSSHSSLSFAHLTPARFTLFSYFPSTDLNHFGLYKRRRDSRNRQQTESEESGMTSETSEKNQVPKTMTQLLCLYLQNNKRFLPLLAVLFVLFASGFAISTEFESGSTSESASFTQRGVPRGARSGSSGIRFALQSSATASASSPDRNSGEQLLNDFDGFLRSSSEKRQNENAERMLIHHGAMTLETKKGNMDSLATQIEDIVKTDGKGYVQSKSTHLSRFDQTRTMSLEVRVVSQNFSSVVGSIQRLVPPEMVISVSVNSQDVTEEYVDVTTRADVLNASRASLQNLMKTANGVKDIIEIHRELNELTGQYEQFQRRANTLRKLSVRANCKGVILPRFPTNAATTFITCLHSHQSFSRLNIEITERAPQGEDMPKPWFNPTEKMQLALTHMAKMIGFMAETIAYASVWLVPTFALYIVFITFHRRRSGLM
jgi:hypothetical protein